KLGVLGDVPVRACGLDLAHDLRPLDGFEQLQIGLELHVARARHGNAVCHGQSPDRLAAVPNRRGAPAPRYTAARMKTRRPPRRDVGCAPAYRPGSACQSKRPGRRASGLESRADEADGARLVGVAIVFYGLLFAAALIWARLEGRPLAIRSQGIEVSWLRDV